MAQLGRQAVSFQIFGLKRNDPLPKLMRSKFGLKKRRKLLVDCLKFSVLPIKEQMENTAPVDTGRLKGSFAVEQSKKHSSLTQIAVYVGATKKARVIDGEKVKSAGWRAHWAELGVRPHGRHPGHPGANFIQPAIQQNLVRARRRLQVALVNLLQAAKTGKPFKIRTR